MNNKGKNMTNWTGEDNASAIEGVLARESAEDALKALDALGIDTTVWAGTLHLNTQAALKNALLGWLWDVPEDEWMDFDQLRKDASEVVSVTDWSWCAIACATNDELESLIEEIKEERRRLCSTTEA